MANYIVTDTELTSIADAIRSKSGGSGGLIFPAGFVSEIDNIGSAWTLLGSKDFTVSTTSTSAGSAGSISCGSTAYDKSKIIYVRVRDKAGKRAGYFLGSDAFFFNYNNANGSTSTISTAIRAMHRYTADNSYALYCIGSTTGYGVYGYSITSAGIVNIYRRYNASYSLTIDGTYTVDVYGLTWPDGISIYDI